MPAQFTLPPDTRAVGTGNPPADMNALIDAVYAMGGYWNVLNTAFAGGADPTGVADSTAAFQAALNAAPYGGVVMVPAVYWNGSAWVQAVYKTTAPITIPPSITLRGPSDGNVFSIENYGPVIQAASTWAIGTAPYAAVLLLLNSTDGGYSTITGVSEEQKIIGLSIDVSHPTNTADGICGYGNVQNVLIRDVAIYGQIAGGTYTSSTQGNGVSQVIAHAAIPMTWRGERIICRRVGLSGFLLISTDSTWVNCETIGSGQQGTSVPGWNISTCSNSTFVGCRSENQGNLGNNFTYTGANNAGGGVSFVGCSTVGGGGHGFEITTNVNSGGCPVTLTGLRVGNDGWNPFQWCGGTGGTGGGGYAGIYIHNAAMVIQITGCQVVPGTAGAGNSPQYGLKVATDNSLRHSVINVSNCLLWGDTAGLNTDGSCPNLVFDGNCVFATGTGSSPVYLIPGNETTVSAAGNLIPAGRPDLALLPATATGSTIPRNLVTTNNVAFVSGTVYVTPILLTAGCPVNSLNFFQGATVETAGTNGWFVLLDSTRKVVAVTANQTGATFFGAANATITLATTAPYVPPVTGYYYIGVCTVVSSGLVPNWQTGTALAANQTTGITGAPTLGGTSSTAQTTPPALGTTMAAISGVAADQLFGWTT
jgi:hypothetical protein